MAQKLIPGHDCELTGLRRASPFDMAVCEQAIGSIAVSSCCSDDGGGGIATNDSANNVGQIGSGPEDIHRAPTIKHGNRLGGSCNVGFLNTTTVFHYVTYTCPHRVGA